MASRIVERVGLAVLAVAIVATMSVLYLAADRVRALETRELSRASEILDAAPSEGAGAIRLLEAPLMRDDEVIFELCSSSTLEPSAWAAALTATITRSAEAGEVEVLSAPLDERALAGARRSTGGACLDLGRGVIEFDGPYVTTLSWSGALPESGVRFRARTLARRSLVASDRNLVLALLVLVLSAALALYARPLRAAPRSPSLGTAAGLSALAAGILWLWMSVITPMLPRGAFWGLLTGLLLAGVEVLLAVVLIGGEGFPLLGLGRRPEEGSRWLRASPYLWLVLAPLAGLFLFRVASLALRLVPSTGEAPIEAFVSWPSGMLSFAALAVVAPLAEEIFFRGLVYGSIAGDGSHRRVIWACVGSWLAFAAVHLPQTWGSWGGMLSIAIAAMGFTALRATSGSVVVPAVAHLVYNGLLSAQALLSATDG